MIMPYSLTWTDIDDRNSTDLVATLKSEFNDVFDSYYTF